MSNVLWEVQVSLYDALTSNSRFMRYIDNKIFDNAPPNISYPFVKQGSIFAIPWNTHNVKGFIVTRSFQIYTEGEGNHLSFLIFREMNKTLHKKIFNMDNYNMIKCILDTKDTTNEKNESVEKQVLTVYYKVFVQEK